MKIEELMAKATYRRILGIITFTVLMVFGVFNYMKVYEFLVRIVEILRPFLVGFAMAFVLNIILRVLEENVFASLNRKKIKVWEKSRRGVCILLAIIVVFALITMILFLVVPELVSSLQVLAKMVPEYALRISSQAISILEDNNMSEGVIDYLQKNGQKIISDLGTFATGFLGSFFNITMGVTSGAINFIVSLIFAVYLLASKEKLSKNLRYTIYAFAKKEKADTAVKVGSMANGIFRSFVAGQCTEALILASLCFLGMSVLKLPYAMLVSTFIGVTALIPVFGAYIGAALGVFVIFMVDPTKAIYFAIFILILQQLENNLIYPKVVGNSIGLPAIWVMTAIFVCGDVMGIVGILLGVPTFSLIYALLGEMIAKRINEKQLTKEDVLGE